MPDRKSPLDQALELLVYAPIGLAIVARDNLPSLIEKGKQRLDQQMTMARMMGQYAVAEGEKQVREKIEEVGGTVGSLLEQAQGARPPGPPDAGGSPASPEPAAPAASEAPSSNGKAAPEPARSSGDHLAITGYDTLSASQIVQRLAGLSADELDAVRAYEESTRGRRTILSKIGQLQAKS